MSMATVVGKKQLAFVEQLGPRGVGCGPGVDPKDAAGIVSYMNNGTTTRDHECAVLWAGKHLALVYFTSTRYSDNGGRHYCSAHVNVVRRNPDESWNKRGHEVHDCTTDPLSSDVKRLNEGVLWGLGRLTTQLINSYIERAKKLDAEEPDRVAKRKAEKKAERNAEEAKEAAIKAERAALGQKRARMLKLSEEIKALGLDCDSESAGKGRELAALVLEVVFEVKP